MAVYLDKAAVGQAALADAHPSISRQSAENYLASMDNLGSLDPAATALWRRLVREGRDSESQPLYDSESDEDTSSGDDASEGEEAGMEPGEG